MFSSIYITINICTPSSPLLLRKCIVCTNIAETSITVDNVRFVVDSGYVKQKTYDPNRHMESLVVVPISRVAAQQRAGCTIVLFCSLLYYPRLTLYGVVPLYPSFFFLLDFASKISTLTIIIFLVISLSPLVLSPAPLVTISGRAGRTSAGQCYRLYSSDCLQVVYDISYHCIPFYNCNCNLPLPPFYFVLRLLPLFPEYDGRDCSRDYAKSSWEHGIAPKSPRDM